MQSLADEKRNQAIDISIMFALAIIVLIVYGRSFGSDLVFDSHFIVKQDTRLREFSARSLADVFTRNYWWPTMYSNLYRPVSTLAFNVQYSVFGFAQSPAGYQLVNLGLHFVALCLSYRILLRLGAFRWAAFIAVVWFAIHPYVTEVVPNVVGLSDLLAYIAIVFGFSIYLDMLKGDRGYYRGGGLLLVVAVLGVLAKENAISLLALIVWHGLTLGRQSVSGLFSAAGKPCFSRIVAAVLALVLVLGVVVVPKMIHQDRELDFLDPVIADNPLRGESALVARVNALAIMWDNLMNCLLPRTISADYSYGQIELARFEDWSGLDIRILLIALCVIGLGISGLLYVRRDPSYAFGVGAIFVLAIPTANIVLLIGTIRADRLVYPIILPVAMCLGLLIWRLWCILSSRYSPVFVDRFARLAVACLILYFGMISVVTNLRASDWRTTEGFWSAVYATSPNSFKAKLGSAGARDSVTTEDLDGDVLRMRDAIDQLNASRHEAVRMNEGAWEFLALRLILRARHFLDLGDRASAERDLLEAKTWLLRVMDFKDKRGRLYLEKYAHDPQLLRESRVKMDDMLISLSDIHRYFSEYDMALSVLRSRYDDNKLLKNYLKALGRAEADAGNWREGAKQLLKVVLLQPDDVSTSREAAWLIQHKTPSESSRAMHTTKRSRDESGPLLDILDPALDELGKEAATELINDLKEDQREDQARLLARQIRVRLGRGNWLP